MGGVGGDDGRAVLRRAVIFVHAELSCIHGVELGVSVPGFVEVDSVNGLAEKIFCCNGVVADSVVG